MNERSLVELVALLPRQRILIIGDLMLDEYIWGEVRRVSPEAPVPVVEVRSRSDVPGGAANVAANVTSLGGVAMLGGVVGADAPGERLCAALRSHGLAAEGILSDDQRPTTIKTRIVAHQQQVVRLDCEQRAPLRSGLEDALLRWTEQQLPQVQGCILSDYGKGVITPRVAQQFIRQARSAGKPVVVDPKGADYVKYRGATVVKPNLHEALRVCKKDPDDAVRLLDVGRELLEILAGTAVLLTRGAEGLSLFCQGTPPMDIPSMARDVFDVTGAGDTVVSTLALALAAGAPLYQAADLANRAAGIVVGKIGTATVSWQELHAATS
jgi:D-glycero-beta-D-manno-heptose-7-phosphate kinase